MTIKDVAEKAKVSVATVSRVINNDPSVRIVTRDRVLQAIEECHYVPNAVARYLRTDSTKSIGLVVSDITNPHFSMMAKSIEEFAQQHGYMVLLCGTNEDSERELNYLRKLQAMRVDGIILNTTAQNDSYIADLSTQLPMVLIERSIEGHGFHGDFIGTNNQAAIELITNYLIQNGHTKIGIINSNFRYSTGRNRYLGFVKAMSKIGIEINDGYLYRYDTPHFSVDGGLQGCRSLMEQEAPPTAIVAANNTLALGALKYLRMHQIRIPQDISILSYGAIDNDELFYIRPGFASSDPHQIGESAIRCLLSRVKDPCIENREVIIEPSLVINESVRNIFADNSFIGSAHIT